MFPFVFCIIDFRVPRIVRTIKSESPTSKRLRTTAPECYQLSDGENYVSLHRENRRAVGCRDDIAKRPANWASANADILPGTKRDAPPILHRRARCSSSCSSLHSWKRNICVFWDVPLPSFLSFAPSGNIAIYATRSRPFGSQTVPVIVGGFSLSENSNASCATPWRITFFTRVDEIARRSFLFRAFPEDTYRTAAAKTAIL